MATVTALQLKSAVFTCLGQQRSGTATGGGTTSLVDSTLINLPADRFPMPLEGKQIRVIDGAAAGDLRYIAKADPSTGTLCPNRAFSSTGPAAGNKYEIWGSSIDGGQPLTDLLSGALKVAKPLKHSQLTIVTNQEVYDITALVDDPDDVVEVYVRTLDPAGVTPYRQRPIFWFKAYPLSDNDGLQAMKLRICPALTLNSPATEELWVQHYKTLAPFTSDTSTFDATYKEWLAWEAVFQHALQMQRNNTDKGRWQELARQAAPFVKKGRAAFAPLVPRRSMHGSPQVM